MSLKIGTNFEYQGHDFLDYRQGLPQAIEDFRDWDYQQIPVPLGFEACLDGVWYVYRGEDYYDEETGHWERRGTGGSGGGDYDEQISKLMNAVFPASFHLSATTPTSNLLGSTVTPKFTWSLVKDSLDVLDKVWIKGPGDSDWVLQGNIQGKPPKSFEGGPTSTKVTYSVKAASEDGTTKSGSLTWDFYQNCYWGTILNPDALSVNLSSFGAANKARCTSSDHTVTFDCSGGKYILYVLPIQYFSSKFKMIIGGFENSNWTSRELTLTNEAEHEDTYVAVWLNDQQHGSSIEITFKKN